MKRGRIVYSAGELAFVEARRAMNRAELREAFVREFGRDEITADHIKSLCTRKGWTTRERWTEADDATIRALYPNTKTERIAKQLGRSLSSVYQRARTLGLEKTAEYLASDDACRVRGNNPNSIAHRFQKGQTPANKGIKHPKGWAPGRMRETQFRKGHAPHNTKWVGHERVSKDGYVEISVPERNPHTGYERRHVLKHRWLWEQANGKVPRGMALKCLDGNKQNTDPSNWTLVPRGVLPRLNGRHRRGYDHAPAELKPTILAVAKLEHAVKNRKRA